MADRDGAGERGVARLQAAQRRRGKQCRVGDAAGDDDIGALFQGLADRRAAQVGMRAHQGGAADVAVPCDVLGQRHHVVAEHGRNAQALQAKFGRELGDRLPGGARVGLAEVGDNAATGLDRHRQQRCQPTAQPRVEPGSRIGGTRLQRRQQGALGQAFEGDDVDLAGRGERHRRVDAVAGETRAGTDAADYAAHHKPM